MRGVGRGRGWDEAQPRQKQKGGGGLVGGEGVWRGERSSFRVYSVAVFLRAFVSFKKSACFDCFRRLAWQEEVD